MKSRHRILPLLLSPVLQTETLTVPVQAAHTHVRSKSWTCNGISHWQECTAPHCHIPQDEHSPKAG